MPFEIDQEINSVLKRRRVSNSTDLEGFVIDAHHFLEESGFFANVNVKKTSDPRAAVVITCSVADSSLSASDVVAALERIWTEEFAYFGGPEQHQTTVQPDQIELRFMSEADPEDLFVTGKIVVDTSAVMGT